jgi:hypothetical protein
MAGPGRSAQLVALASPPGASAGHVGLGAYYCPNAKCDATSAGTLDAYRERFGRYPEIALNFRDLDQPLIYPGEGEGLRSRGVTPMLTVEPVITGNGREEEISSAAIASGRYDAEIRADAEAAARFGAPLLLRYAQEMNATWFPRRSADAGDFVAAWRRYVTIFRRQGADNVAFVWTPVVEIQGTKPMGPFFPGEEFVDYVGLDGYNWGGESRRSFGEVFSRDYARVTGLSTKPMVIGETASAPGPAKGSWIREAFLREIPRRFPAVVAVAWFSKDLSHQGQRDWRIETSSDAAAAWREVLAAAPYGGSELLPRARPGAHRLQGASPGEGSEATRQGRGVRRRPSGPTPLQALLLDVALWLGRLAWVLLGH